MSTFKIISVEIKPGLSFSRGWSKPMQEIETNEGVFIDNAPGQRHGHWVGHSWKNEIGYTIEATVVSNSGYKWLEFRKRL